MIVRKIDELGRIVIPAEFRKELFIEPGTELGLSMNGSEIRVVSMEQACRFCGATENLVMSQGKVICSRDLAELARARVSE